MKQRLIRKLVGFITVFTLLFSFTSVFAMQPVFAQDAFQKGACQGANLNLSDANCDPKSNADTVKAASTVDTIIKTVINVLTFVVGLAAVIMIIIGGLKYITSGGDSGKVSNAKDTILYAIIGLVVVAFAQIVVRFILNKVR